MNYYSFYDDDEEEGEKINDVFYLGGIESDQCCGGMEVVLQCLTDHRPLEMVRLAVTGAMQENATLLAWNLLPAGKPYYKEVEKIVQLLPATKLIAKYRNRRTGRTIHAYVTNLTEEWV